MVAKVFYAVSLSLSLWLSVSVWLILQQQAVLASLLRQIPISFCCCVGSHQCCHYGCVAVLLPATFSKERSGRSIKAAGDVGFLVGRGHRHVSSISALAWSAGPVHVRNGRFTMERNRIFWHSTVRTCRLYRHSSPCFLSSLRQPFICQASHLPHLVTCCVGLVC